MAIDKKKIDESYEMKALKKELADFRRNSLKFVTDAANEENALKRAQLLTSRLKTALAFKSGRQCPPGTVWDAETKTCI